MLNYLSVCSGIEAASVAWGTLGFHPVGFSEIDKFPCAVLAHHFPQVRNYGDMTQFREWDIEPGSVDVLVGGTPCQSFSIAGLRGGIEDSRGNLALTYCRILQELRPRWFVWENVPGVLSSNGGRDFGSILGAMVKLGYGIAYRILNSEYFGVPQRRRRVFVVGCLGGWRRAAEVLFEPGCLRGNSAKGRKKKSAVAALTANGVGTCGADDNQGQGGHLIASTGNRSHCLNAGGMGRQDYEMETMIVESFRTAGDGAVYDSGDVSAPLTSGRDPGQNIIAIQERAVSTNETNGPGGSGIRTDGKAFTLEARHHVQAVAYRVHSENSHAMRDGGTADMASETNMSRCLDQNGGWSHNQGGNVLLSLRMGVRRLTPMECERLQGFPDGWTLVPHHGKPAADGPRYKAIGNSMAVPCMRWIGQRIMEQETTCHPAS